MSENLVTEAKRLRNGVRSSDGCRWCCPFYDGCCFHRAQRPFLLFLNSQRGMNQRPQQRGKESATNREPQPTSKRNAVALPDLFPESGCRNGCRSSDVRSCRFCDGCCSHRAQWPCLVGCFYCCECPCLFLMAVASIERNGLAVVGCLSSLWRVRSSDGCRS